jgi:hypothetical protein
MGTRGNDTIFMILVFAALLALFVVLVRLLLKWRREGLDLKSKKTSKEAMWLSLFHYLWWLLGAAAAALKCIYREWKTAPEGSPAQFWWGMLLAVIVALAMFAVVKMVDRKLNGPNASPAEESAGSEY